MQYPKFCRRPHAVHDEIFKSPEAIILMKELSTCDRLPPKRLAEISKTTNIKYKTLETWRRKLKCDPNYIPIHGKKGNPKKLSVEQENVIFKKLEEMYLDNSRYCPPRINKSLAKQVIPDYSFSDGLLLGFMECFNLSSRVPHMKRRTNPNDEQVSRFLENM